MSLKRIIRSIVNKYPHLSWLDSVYARWHGRGIKLLSYYDQKRNTRLVQTLRAKVKRGERIRVGFYVTYSSIFQTRYLYEEMRKDSLFEPFILVIPDVLRGEQNMMDQMSKTYDDCASQYDRVYRAYDADEARFIDFKDKVDIIFFNSPYDSMTHEYYRARYIQGKKPYCHANYAYLGRTCYESQIVKQRFYYRAWMIFIESEQTLQEMRKMHYLLDNLRLSGYCKLDAIARIPVATRTRKRIIIAPHHTVYEWKGGLNLSNFLRFADFFLTLPELFPEVDFIFRPHPMLFINLKRDPNWGEEKVAAYLAALTSHDNAHYDTSDDYLESLVNSDALIHDCGSFLAEYFYTDHPQCYLLNERSFDEFLDYGKYMLDHCYHAYSERDLEDFIRKVVIDGDDAMQGVRARFSDKVVKHNYPHASQHVISTLKGALGVETTNEIK